MQRMCDGSATFGAGRTRRALVVLMCGLPAAGKTTTAERLHAGLGGVLIRSCDVYQELGISLPDWVQRTRGFTHDVTAYEQARDAAYARMRGLLECHLTTGAELVIIDAVHGEPAKRRAVFHVCAAFGADPLLVWCRCNDQKETERRIMRRRGAKPIQPARRAIAPSSITSPDSGSRLPTSDADRPWCRSARTTRSSERSIGCVRRNGLRLPPSRRR